MALTFRAATTEAGAAANSITIDKPAGVASGDVLLAGLYTESATPVAPAGWDLIGSAVTHTQVGFVCQIYEKIAGGSEGADYTWTTTGAAWVYGGMIAYSGHTGTGNPIDATSNVQWYNVGAGEGLFIPSVTVSNANTTLVAFCFGYFDNPDHVNYAAGTNQRIKGNGVLIEDGVVASAGASGGSTPYPTGTDHGIGFHIALLDSSSGGGPAAIAARQRIIGQAVKRPSHY